MSTSPFDKPGRLISVGPRFGERANQSGGVRLFPADTPQVYVGMNEEDIADVLSKIAAVRDEAEALRDRIGDLGLGRTYQSTEVMYRNLEEVYNWVEATTIHPEP